MKDVYLHIGLPKTGSTSIQNFCIANEEFLLDNDIFYPPVAPGFYGHSHLSNIRINAFGMALKASDTMNEMVSTIKTAKQSRAIISEEIFCEQSPIDFWALFKQFNVKVIVYLRSPALLEQSAVQFEAMSFLYHSQSPMGVSPRGLYTEENILYRSYHLLSKLKTSWLDTIPIESFIFRDFDKVSQNGSLISDFLEIFQLKLEGRCDQSYSKANISLKTDYLYFLSHSNMIPLKFSDRISLLNNLSNMSSTNKSANNYCIIDKKSLSKISKTKTNLFAEFGKIINRDDFFTFGLEEISKLQEVPYTNLPSQIEFDIFSRLAPSVQAAMIESWPAMSNITPETGALPKFPINQTELDTLSNWHLALNRATKNVAQRNTSDTG